DIRRPCSSNSRAADVIEMPRCCSSSIQSDVACRRSLRPRTAPASSMAPAYSNSFSVSVVLPASGCEIIANVRRLATSRSSSASGAGHAGGDSESIIGRWMAARGTRNRMVVATKGGMKPGLKGLSPATIRKGAEGSLQRLATDRIDLYYAHADDPDTPLVESLRAFDALVKEGKVCYIAASNYTAPRLAEALAVSRREHVARYIAIQPHYNLVHRSEYEGELRDLCVRD